MKKQQHRSRVKGFTLIELIVVIAIIGILVAILGPTMSGYYWKSRVRSANATAKMVYNASQTAVQKYIAADRGKAATDATKSLYGATYTSGSNTLPYTVMVRYDRNTGNSFFWKSGDDDANNSNNWTQIGSGDAHKPYRDLVQSVLRTVSDSSEYNWAVTVENYIVKASVAAASDGTNFVGYYTKGSITVERNSTTYANSYAALLEEKKAVYNTND